MLPNSYYLNSVLASCWKYHTNYLVNAWHKLCFLYESCGGKTRWEEWMIILNWSITARDLFSSTSLLGCTKNTQPNHSFSGVTKGMFISMHKKGKLLKFPSINRHDLDASLDSQCIVFHFKVLDYLH